MQSPVPLQKSVSPADAAKRIASSQTLAVVLPETPAFEVIGSAIALISGLRVIGKVTSVFVATPAERSLVPWNILVGDEEPLREFIISFDLARSPIKELKYERAENRLDIILSPTGRIRREDVEFRRGELRYDLVITLGAPSLEALAASIRRAPELLHEKPILNIDASPANQCYGELNLLPDTGQTEPPTLAELTYALLGALAVPAQDPERASALFAALGAATDEFQPERTTASAFRLAGELRGLGAAPDAFRKLAPLRPSLDAIQLAGRALARSRFEESSGTLWAILTADDFIKTVTTPADVESVLGRIRKAIPRAIIYVLMWQDPSDNAVWAMWESVEGPTRSRKTLERSFPSFAAAEEHLRQLLPTPDAVE